jgi:hypothetical protein
LELSIVLLYEVQQHKQEWSLIVSYMYKIFMT